LVRSVYELQHIQLKRVETAARKNQITAGAEPPAVSFNWVKCASM
jgi:hypothetical protein